jgi:hypothetical protein
VQVDGRVVVHVVGVFVQQVGGGQIDDVDHVVVQQRHIALAHEHVGDHLVVTDRLRIPGGPVGPEHRRAGIARVLVQPAGELGVLRQ